MILFYEKTISKGYAKILMCLLLSLMVLILYRHVQDFDFIDYDDNMYVVENPHIQQGFTRDAVIWAFQDVHTGHWHPLTWLSHMLDWRFFGYNAGGHHWTNLLFHLANTLLLFLLLDYMTGEMWKSAFAAALFALHPLNVESVAWVAERKNVLSTFFWLAAMGVYAYYVNRPGLWRYGAVVLLFALGLLAKPMLVTLPLVLLLLDFWPLRRLPISKHVEDINLSRQFFALLWEKVPLFILSILSALTAIYAAGEGGALRSFAAFPLAVRLGNAFISLVRYPEKMIFPYDLAVFYPFSADYPLWKPVGAAFLFAVITWLVFCVGRRYRYLIVGWFWYLITLMPVIGIIQVGHQSMADRYVYVSGIGLFLILAWGIPDLTAGISRRKLLLGLSATTLLLLFSLSASRQVSYWQGSSSLFQQALQVTKNNHLAHLALGTFLLKKGSIAEAALHFEKTIKIKPASAEARNNLGIVSLERGDFAGARLHFEEAIKINPKLEKAYSNIGVLLIMQGKKRDALTWFQKALKINPHYPDARKYFFSIQRQLDQR